MDFYKLKWKMKFRLKKLKGFFKLCEYKFRHKFHLEGDAQFYYYLQRQNMEDLVKADPEQEYLEEHGLLPEESGLEPEPEPEKEPGLIKEMDAFTLMTRNLSVGDIYYTPFSMKEYIDHILLTISRLGEDYKMTEHRFELPVEGRFSPFELDGIHWLWDREDCALRIVPDFDTSARKELNEHFALLGESVLAVERNYAEEKLSDKCRSYAFQMDAKAYYWCMLDDGFRAVCHERPELFFANAADAEFNRSLLVSHCPGYFADE